MIHSRSRLQTVVDSKSPDRNMLEPPPAAFRQVSTGVLYSSERAVPYVQHENRFMAYALMQGILMYALMQSIIMYAPSISNLFSICKKLDTGFRFRSL